MRYEVQLKPILQEALNLIYKVKCFEEEAMFKAQKLGIQGEKRRLRYESACNHNLINYLRSDAFDSYGIEVKPEKVNVTIPEITEISEFFNIYLQKMEEQYDSLHTIANNLVQHNCRHYAKILYDKCEDLIDDIKYYKRTIREGDITNWSPEFILVYEKSWENIHDCYESKEKEVGYNF